MNSFRRFFSYQRKRSEIQNFTSIKLQTNILPHHLIMDDVSETRKFFEETPLSKVMKTNVLVLEEDATVLELLQVLSEKQLSALPISKGGVPFAVVDTADLVRHCVQLATSSSDAVGLVQATSQFFASQVSTLVGMN